MFLGEQSDQRYMTLLQNGVKCVQGMRDGDYLQHVTKHVHTLENGEPELRNAFWIFLWHGFLFFRILNRSFFLYLRLRPVQQNSDE